MVPNQVLPQASRAEGCQDSRSAPPSASALLCGMQAGLPHYVPTIPLQPFDPAWVTCMSSASQQPHGGVSPAEAKLPLPSQGLAVPREAGLQCGESLPASSPPGLSPNSGTLGFAAEARAGTGGGGPGPLVRPVPIAAALLSCH